MGKKRLLIVSAISAVCVIVAAAVVSKRKAKKTTYKATSMEAIPIRKKGFYEKYIKRALDVICASGAIIAFSPVYLIVALLVRVKLGSPVLFAQDRPGMIEEDGKETVFKMFKFRTMTDERDEEGNLLPDEVRLTKFGAWLRSTSLDELPEAFNILNGSMSICGPRPQLVRDMVYMTKEQRMRHTAKPGLSGLAQINGRNAITWEEKLDWDLKYIQNISLFEDIRIIFKTVEKAFIKQEGITEEDMATAEDFGDYLRRTEKVNEDEYFMKQNQAKNILNGIVEEKEKGLVSIVMPSYNTANYIEETIQSVLDQTYTKLELLIVDDCSSDNTLEVLEQYQDERIKIFVNDKNSGAALSRNKALQEARGQWIAFLDSDDLWSKDKLEKQISFMEKNGYAFTYTNYEEMDSEGNLTGVHVTGPMKITQTGMFNYCWPGCLTVMYDAEKIGLIQIADIKKNNDYAMWLKVCKKADCYLLDEYLAQYRKGRIGSVSSHSIKTMVGWHYKLFYNAEGMNMIPSIIHTGINLLFGFYKKKRFVKKTC